MIVVADATPLRYLVLIGEAQILSVVFGEVLIPPAVFEELSQGGTPEAVRQWVARRPGWLQVRAPQVSSTSFPVVLGAGERDAISLAEELKADVLLVDDWQARREAARRNLAIQGTLGLLEAAAARGLLSLPEVFARLRTTNFRVSEELIQIMLKRDADFKKPR
jgi:predicted nucleic acid-binding protein